MQGAVLSPLINASSYIDVFPFALFRFTRCSGLYIGLCILELKACGSPFSPVSGVGTKEMANTFWYMQNVPRKRV